MKKEQIDTLFVRVGLLQGGFCGLGGWFRGGPTHFLRGVPLLFFLPSCDSIDFVEVDVDGSCKI